MSPCPLLRAEQPPQVGKHLCHSCLAQGHCPGTLLRMWLRDFVVPQRDSEAAAGPGAMPGCDVRAASMPGCHARPTARRWQSHTHASATQRQVAAPGDTDQPRSVPGARCHSLCPTPHRQDGHAGNRALCPAGPRRRDTGTLPQPLCPPGSPMSPGTSEASPVPLSSAGIPEGHGTNTARGQGGQSSRGSSTAPGASQGCHIPGDTATSQGTQPTSRPHCHHHRPGDSSTFPGASPPS